MQGACCQNLGAQVAARINDEAGMLSVKYVGVVVVALGCLLATQGCSTAVAVVDTAASIVVYTGKTIVNTVDAVTPDIVNGDD
jgi:hypothetical protein